jgi:hypothetical protein
MYLGSTVVPIAASFSTCPRSTSIVFGTIIRQPMVSAKSEKKTKSWRNIGDGKARTAPVLLHSTIRLSISDAKGRAPSRAEATPEIFPYPLVDWGEKNEVWGAGNRQSGESNERSEVPVGGAFDAPSRFPAGWSCVGQKRALPLFFPLLVLALTDGRASALASGGAYMVAGRALLCRYRALHVVLLLSPP